MFEIKFLDVLENLDNEEERKIAYHIRNQQIISQLKSMSDEEFINFREIVLRNFNAVEQLFNYLFYQNVKAIDEIEDFEYNDLFKYYYDNIRKILERNHLTLACMQSIHKDFMVPFYQYKDEVLLALGNRNMYVKYLESNLDQDCVMLIRC